MSRRGFGISDIPAVKNFKKEHKTATFVIILLILFGWMGMRIYSYQQKKAIVESCTEKTEGEIVSRDLKTNFTRRHGNKYRGVVEFEVEGEKYHAYTAWQRSAFIKRGSHVTVWYDPSDPSRNCTESSKNTANYSWTVFGLIGVVILLVVLSFGLKDSKIFSGGRIVGGQAGSPGKKEFDPYSFDSYGGDVGGVEVPKNPYEQPKSYDDIFK